MIRDDWQNNLNIVEECSGNTQDLGLKLGAKK